jgi:hypothetical protein
VHEVEQLFGAVSQLGSRETEVATVDDEVVPDRQLEVEGVVLGDHAEAAADRRSVACGVETEHPQLARRHGRDAADHAHGRCLAGAVGTEEAEELAPRHREVDGVDRDEVVEPLRERAAGDDGFGRFPHVGDATPPAGHVRTRFRS